MIEQLIAVAALVERTVQFVKSVIKYDDFAEKHQALVDQILVFVFSAGLCYYWQVDVFAEVGIILPLQLGAVLTGVFAALGSNIVHELFELLKLARKARG